VMPPASPSCTFVRRILSSNLVLPVSTCPRTQRMGERSLSLDLSLSAPCLRSNRASFAAAIAAAAASRFALSFSSSSDSVSDSSSAGRLRGGGGGRSVLRYAMSFVSSSSAPAERALPASPALLPSSDAVAWLSSLFSAPQCQ